MEEAWRDTVIAIERAHCIGQFTKGRTWPIVVKFANYKHKNIFKNRSKLQGSNYHIQEQFSDKIMQKGKFECHVKHQKIRIIELTGQEMRIGKQK